MARRTRAKKQEEIIIPTKVGDLFDAPYNPRIISEEADMALDASMGEFGDISGFVFNTRTGYMVSGHQRKRHLPADAPIINYVKADDEYGTVGYGDIKVGKSKWRVRFVDWDETKEKAANVAANNNAMAGEFTPDVEDILDELKKEMPDVYDSMMLYEALEDVDGKSRNKKDKDEGKRNKYAEQMALDFYESYDYIILLYKDERDWTAAMDHFGLSKAYKRQNSSQTGLGRVIDGAKYLKRIIAGGSE